MRKLSRRSFIGRVTGGLVAGGALTLLGGTAEARQTQRSGCNDSDRNPGDPGGNGRRCRTPAPTSWCSDRDPGDPAGRGRNCVPGMESPSPAS